MNKALSHIFDVRGWYVSPITLRILAVNVGALLILCFGLLYSGQYEREMIRNESRALGREAALIASALADGGVRMGEGDNPMLADDLVLQMLRKMSETNAHRTLVFSKTGQILVDSHQLLGPGGMVEIAELPPPLSSLPLREKVVHYIHVTLDFLPTRLRLPRYRVEGRQSAQSYPYMIEALQGEVTTGAWRDQDGRILITTEMPIQNLKNVLGGIMLMQDGANIDAAVRDVQLSVLCVFLFALVATILLSMYLSETIARPIMRLSQAATKVRQSLTFREAIPDFSYRNDEIGRLSAAFRDMTQALSDRIDAISHFASDVAHEIKNPLASLKSAIGTLPMVKDGAQREKLLAIINEDVNRINRLITDISNASRMDSELTHAEKSTVELNSLLEAVKRYASALAPVMADGTPKPIRINMKLPPHRPITVLGNDGQIFQVLQNIVSNAVSFVTPAGSIEINAHEEENRVIITIDNDGPAIPERNLETIFNRFYSERPKDEKFGLHSGLGLSISRQIVKAHQGTIFAENIKFGGATRGVRFTVILPRGARLKGGAA